MFSFGIEKNETNVLLKASGRIDNEGIHIFQESLNQLLEADSEKLILNFNKLEFINSSGIGKLLIFYKKAKNLGKETIISGISDEIYTLFKAIRLDKHIEIKQ